MKKSSILCLTAGLALALLAGCAGEKAPEPSAPPSAPPAPAPAAPPTPPPAPPAPPPGFGGFQRGNQERG